MLFSTAPALLCFAVRHVGAESIVEPHCSLSLLQYTAQSEVILESDAASGRAACNDWCSGNTFDWTAKCGWNTCGGCDICDSIALPTVQPTPSPTPTVEGCRSWCADDPSLWEAKCTWRNCHACNQCPQPTPTPTQPPTPPPTGAPSPSPTAPPTPSPTCSTAFDNSKCNSWLLDACCGVDGVTVGCSDGYEVVRTGTCGLIGARTQYTCKPRCDSLIQKHDSAVPLKESLTQDKTKDIIANCDESMQSFDVSMACISRAVYNFPLVGKKVADWSLEVESVDDNAIGDLPGLGTDKMSIYKNGQGTCALAISGSDDANDWVTDFTFATKQACGLEMHSGFYNELNRLTEGNKKWPQLKAYLQTNCDTTWFVGHSLGGALVSALAACLVAGTESALEGLPFDGLYTFGAPAISTTPATNKDGGCFPGKRIYNLDFAGGDPVPAITDAVGLRHPKMAAVRLWDKWLGGVVQEETKCDEEATYSIPHFGIIPMAEKHLPSWYINREKDVA